MTRCAVQVAALVLLSPLYLCAQPYLGSAGADAGTIEIGGGVLWARGYDAGGGDAVETRNGSSAPGPLTLFETDARMLGAVGVAAQIGVYLGRRVAAEAVFQYSRPILRVRPVSDFEDAESVDIDGQVATYVIGGSLVYHFTEGRVVPFVSGGGGYLRQLHDGNAVVVAGSEIHAGGGVKVWLGPASRIGLRLDAQVSARDKAVAFEAKRRIVPTVGAGLTVRF